MLHLGDAAVEHERAALGDDCIDITQDARRKSTLTTAAATIDDGGEGKKAGTSHADVQGKGAGTPMRKNTNSVCSLCGAPAGPLCLSCSWEQQGPARWITEASNDAEVVHE